MAGHDGSWPGRPIPVLVVLLLAVAGLAGCTRGADHDQDDEEPQRGPV